MHLTFPNDVIKYLYDFWIPVRRARWIDRSHLNFAGKGGQGEGTGLRDAGHSPLPGIVRAAVRALTRPGFLWTGTGF